MAPASASHLAGRPHIAGPSTAPNELGRCTGVDKGDNGEENTLKVLTGGTLVPGGTAEYRISFPASDAEETKSFVVLDCLFAGGKAIARYEITEIAKTLNPDDGKYYFDFFLEVDLPDLPLGTEICNVAQTTGQVGQQAATARPVLSASSSAAPSRSSR